MRYTLRRNGLIFARGKDIMDIINGCWPDIKRCWADGWTLHDNAQNLKWDTWAVVYTAAYGIEISAIQS